MQLRWMSVLALGLVSGVLAQPAPAEETCYDYCTDGCPAGPEDSRSECTDNCAVRCSPGGDLDETRPWSSTTYGAIAYDADNVAYGWSFKMNSGEAAEKKALSNCANYGDSCKVVVTFSNSCAAVAAGEKKHYATGQGSSREEAQSKAMAACGGNCEIKAWSCSLP